MYRLHPHPLHPHTHLQKSGSKSTTYIQVHYYFGFHLGMNVCILFHTKALQRWARYLIQPEIALTLLIIYLQLKMDSTG